MSDPFVTATDDRSKVTVFVDGTTSFLARKVGGVWQRDRSFEAQDLYDNFALVPSKEAAALTREAMEYIEKQAGIEKGVQLMEDRLGVEVDRDDPMLPAMGQIELALQRMMEKAKPDKEPE
jgi:hypothetical protein